MGPIRTLLNSGLASEGILGRTDGERRLSSREATRWLTALVIGGVVRRVGTSEA